MDNQDLLQNILTELQEVKLTMATKDELKEIRKEMATKDELKDMRKEMKSEMNEMREETKSEFEDIRSNMATKKDVEPIPVIQQAVLEISAKVNSMESQMATKADLRFQDQKLIDLEREVYKLKFG